MPAGRPKGCKNTPEATRKMRETRAKNLARFGPQAKRRAEEVPARTGGPSYDMSSGGDYTIAHRWHRYGARLWEERNVYDD